MSTSLAILLGGIITFGVRLSFIQLNGRFQLPQRVKRALRFVPPAVLSALVLPELTMPSGSLDLSLHNYRLIAGCVALLVAWRTKNTMVTILVGMIVLLLLSAVF